MSKSIFLNLRDDSFWGNDEDDDDEHSKENLTSWSSDDSLTAEKKQLNKDMEKGGGDALGMAEADEGWQEEEAKGWDGWEDVKNDKKAEKVHISHNSLQSSPFGNGSGGFGGFSRTNASSYQQYTEDSARMDRNKRTNEYPCNNSMVNLHLPYMNAANVYNSSPPSHRFGHGDRQVEDLLARRDFTSLDVLTAMYKEKAAKKSKEVEKENQNFLANFSADPWVRQESSKLNLIDEKYADYYEYLCQGLNKVLKSDSPIQIDCDSRSSNSNQSSSCRALKSKYYHQYNIGPENYSRKVFVGGLPIDISEDQLIDTFSPFGPLVVDWPNKNETKSYYPPKGYVFLIFEYEMSVRALVDHCIVEDDKYFLSFCSSSSAEKLKVQIRPWRLADADYLVDVNVPVNLRRVVFVGGVPRPTRAVELAHMMDCLYGSVVCAGIDTDVEFKYPKGAGRVAFTNYSSYMKAITDRYAYINHGEVEKRVEIKPYVLDDQICEECCGEQNGGRHAPFYCPHLECLQYYCESCWTEMHSSTTREHHKPLVKEA